MYFFTKKEREVLKLMAHGYSNKEIAQKMNLKITTIETHAHNIYGKLGLMSQGFIGKPKTLAVIYYWQKHLNDLEKLDFFSLESL